MLDKHLTSELHPSPSWDSFFFWTGVWIQGFMRARQVLYYLSHSSSPHLEILNDFSTRAPRFHFHWALGIRDFFLFLVQFVINVWPVLTFLFFSF
jgi:hypothetical protein